LIDLLTGQSLVVNGIDADEIRWKRVKKSRKKRKMNTECPALFNPNNVKGVGLKGVVAIKLGEKSLPSSSLLLMPCNPLSPGTEAPLLCQRTQANRLSLHFPSNWR